MELALRKEGWGIDELRHDFVAKKAEFAEHRKRSGGSVVDVMELVHCRSRGDRIEI